MTHPLEDEDFTRRLIAIETRRMQWNGTSGPANRKEPYESVLPTPE